MIDDPCGALATPGHGRQIGLEREMSTFFYMLLAFIVGILVGWFIWGRLRGELDSLRGDLDRTRSERDKLRADSDRLTGELNACGKTRSDLERRLRDTPSAPAKPSGQA